MPPAVLERELSRTGTSAQNHCADEPLFEVVQGSKVELPAMSSYSNQITNLLLFALFQYADETKNGTALGGALFAIPSPSDPDKQRRPDVAYISKHRWPLDQRAPDTDPWPVVPNLAVEVLSPTDRVFKVSNKIVEYFEAGVELVWIVDPNQEMVTIYTAPRQHKELMKTDTLDGGTVVPGFSLPLAQLFR